jgi:hypothetical protein
MAESPEMPQRPAGCQRPQVTGPGIFDPQVRSDIRAKLHAAAHDARPQGVGPPEDSSESAEAAALAPSAAPAPAPTTPAVPSAAAPQGQWHRAGRYPHGDVDLSFISANVPAEAIRPQRGRGPRRFYFLPQPDTSTPSAPVQPPADNPRPD